MYVSLVNKYNQMKSNYNKNNKEKKNEIQSTYKEFRIPKIPTPNTTPTDSCNSTQHPPTSINKYTSNLTTLHKALYSQQTNDSWDHTYMDKSMKNPMPYHKTIKQSK